MWNDIKYHIIFAYCKRRLYWKLLFVKTTVDKEILTKKSRLIAQFVRFRNPLKTSPNAPSPILYSSLKPLVAWFSSLVVKF